jgi:processive rubber oxygenase RoxA-like protein
MYKALKFFRIAVGLGFVVNMIFALPALFAPHFLQGLADFGISNTIWWLQTDGYATQPLDGIWARGPYLHGGSVPTMWDLLTPAEQRPKAFTRGGDKYDQKKWALCTMYCKDQRKPATPIQTEPRIPERRLCSIRRLLETAIRDTPAPSTDRT